MRQEVAGAESAGAEGVYPSSYCDYAAYCAYWQQQYPEAYSKYVAQYQEWQQYMGTAVGQQMMYTGGCGTVGYPYSVVGQEDVAGGFGDQRGVYLRDRGNPSLTLWVGNLPYDCSESDLRITFNRFGPIKTINYLPSRCCAFVTFHDLESSMNAMQQSQSITVKGTYVRINWRKNNNETIRKEDIHNNATNNLWIGMLDPSTTEEDLRQAFQPFGTIENIKFVPSRNYAFVAYSKVEHAIKALEERNGYHLCGSNIKVNFGKYEHQQLHSGSSSDFVRPTKDDLESGNVIVPPPRLKLIIDTLARKMKEIGPTRASELEKALRYHKNDDSNFFFLKGGEGYRYYRWKRANPDEEYVAEGSPSNGVPKSERPPWAMDDKLSPESDDGSLGNDGSLGKMKASEGSDLPPWKLDERHLSHENLTEHELQELLEILDRVEPKQEQIQRAAIWILQHEHKASNIIQTILGQQRLRPTFAGKTSLFFVVHQCLQSSLRSLAADEESTTILEVFGPVLGELCRDIYDSGTEDERQQVITWIESWKTKEIFTPEFVYRILNTLTSTKRPPLYDAVDDHTPSQKMPKPSADNDDSQPQ